MILTTPSKKKVISSYYITFDTKQLAGKKNLYFA